MFDGHRNHLLATLSPEDAALLDGHLEDVGLDHRQVLERAHRPIAHAYFVDEGLGSIAALAAQGRRVEAGLFGREGMSGLPVILGANASPNETFIQIPGAARRIAVAPLREAMDRSPTLRARLLLFAHCQAVQIGQTALANAQAKLEERLARWLLMCHDRVDGDELRLTHEFLSLMLGVRRAGVTVALGALESRSLISVHRGGQAVLDRDGLEVTAGGAYGVPESEYQRLLG